MMIYRRHQKANVVVKHSSGILILLYASVKVGYNAAHNLQTSSWDTCHPLFRDQTIFYFRMCIVNRFRKKNGVCPAKRAYHTNFMQSTTKKGFFIWEFLFVRRNRHARVRSVFADKVMVLESSSHIRYWWSYLTKQVLHLKLL